MSNYTEPFETPPAPFSDRTEASSAEARPTASAQEPPASRPEEARDLEAEA